MSEENKIEATVEAVVTEDRVPESWESDPLEVAAMMMKNFAPRFKRAVQELSTGQLRRLAIALATYPLEYEEILGDDNRLVQTYSLGDKLLQAKTLMIQDVIFKEVEANQKKENEDGKV